MEREEILNRIIEIIIDQIAVSADDIDADTSLTDDLEADSLDLLQIVTAIEDEFDVSVEDDAFEEVSTVGDAADYIASLVG